MQPKLFIMNWVLSDWADHREICIATDGKCVCIYIYIYTHICAQAEAGPKDTSQLHDKVAQMLSPYSCYIIFSLTGCIYGLMGSSLWSIDRGRENSCLIYRWFCMVCRYHLKGVQHHSPFLGQPGMAVWKKILPGAELQAVSTLLRRDGQACNFILIHELLPLVTQEKNFVSSLGDLTLCGPRGLISKGKNASTRRNIIIPSTWMLKLLPCHFGLLKSMNQQVRMVIIKKSTNNKCWRRCGEKGTLLHCGWEGKLVHPLWRIIWRFLKKTKYRINTWSGNPTPQHIPRENYNSKRYMYPGVPVSAWRKWIWLGTMWLWVWSLALLSGLRIWHCRELRCRSQTRFGSVVAVALA